MQKEDLKSKLQTLVANEYAVENEQIAFDLALQMYAHIGTTDAVLRDELIYTTMANWILEQKLFSGAQLRQLVGVVLDGNHLSFKLGDYGTDSVFVRSFSALQLPLLLIAHRERPFLALKDLLQIKSNLLSYFLNEVDVRGFVEHKGWAHGIAHAADAFEDLALCQEMKLADLRNMLDAISTKVGWVTDAFVHGEDERMVTAVIAIINRDQLSFADLNTWLTTLVNAAKSEPFDPTRFRHTNTQTFLRSLYLRLHHTNQQPALQATLLDHLKTINRYL